MGPEGEGVWKKSVHTLTWGGGANPFLCNIFPSHYFTLEIARSSDLAGIIFHLRLEGKK